ncbi:uncharacterized protein LOC128963577 [Oppia nitens]|uniref:uncharacterized protein LOC128963577 n=1 Tax=Oppia nitens TaxID=1686743 RepID=UPI0023DA5488|nr:uncharacterized protein LOC128963577 [Oppia nitens]
MSGSGIMVILIPRLSKLVDLKINYIIYMFVSLGNTYSINIWIVELWGLDCGPYVQVLRLVNSLAGIFGPLFVEPYLSKTNDTLTTNINITSSNINDDDKITTGALNDTSATTTTTTNSTMVMLIKSSIGTPYLIIGILHIVCSLVMMIIFAIRPYVPRVGVVVCKNNHANNNNHNLISKLKLLYKQFILDLAPDKLTCLLTLLSSTLLLIAIGTMSSINIYYPKFVQLYSGLPIQTAAFMTTGLSVGIAVAQLLCIVVTKYLKQPIAILIPAMIVMLVASVATLPVFCDYNNTTTTTTTSELVLWSTTILYGLGFGPVVGCLYNLIELSAPVTNLTGALVTLMANIGNIVWISVLTDWLPNWPISYVYLNIF